MPETTEVKSPKSSSDMLHWQYKTLLGEVQQIELHETGDCPCILSDLNPAEKCLGKHLLNVATLSAETATMDAINKKWLLKLAEEATERHEQFIGFICHKSDLPELTEWCRGWRKNHIEPTYYTCQVKKPPAPAPVITLVPAPAPSSIKAEAKKWLDHWTYESAKGYMMPSTDVVEYLKKYRPAKPVVLYRVQNKNEPAGKVLVSFTHNKKMAESMRDEFDLKDQVVITETVAPEQILVDFTLLPDKEEYLDEVVVWRCEPTTPAPPPTSTLSSGQVCSALAEARETHRHFLHQPPDPKTGSHDWHRRWINVYDNALKTCPCKINEKEIIIMDATKKLEMCENAPAPPPQKLMTKALFDSMPPLYSQENIADPLVRVKFFNPYGAGTWGATEGSFVCPEHGNYDCIECSKPGHDYLCFGWVTFNDGNGELGYFCVGELEG